jgi:hypothetical protein
MSPSVKNEIDAKIFHGRIEKFFDHLGQTVHFIDKKDIPSFQMSKDADEVTSFFKGRPRRGHETNIHLCGNDMGERRLPQPWRGMKENVIQRLPPSLGRLDRNLQGLHYLFLTDIFGELSRPQIEIILNFWRNLFADLL